MTTPSIRAMSPIELWEHACFYYLMLAFERASDAELRTAAIAILLAPAGIP